jgi:hypothetical protein
VDSDLKALRVTTQHLGTHFSGSILASWPDGKVAADQLSFTIDIIMVKNGRKMS